MSDIHDKKLCASKKKEVREEILKRLESQDPFLRKERSMYIQKALLSSAEYKAADVIMTYISLPTEVDTWFFCKSALEKGKRVASPYIGPNSQTIIASELSSMECLEKGLFGIFQPKNGWDMEMPLEEIDLIVVPGIAFDRKNMRLGRGKGYYDKFLASDKLALSKTIGLAFHFQIVDSLPQDPHDVAVHRVITD